MLALLFFGLADLTTTVLGLGVPGVVEAGPVAARVFGASGFIGLVVLKSATFVLAAALFRVLPHPHADGIPIGLVVLGVALTVWNVWVLVAAVPE